MYMYTFVLEYWFSRCCNWWRHCGRKTCDIRGSTGTTEEWIPKGCVLNPGSDERGVEGSQESHHKRDSRNPGGGIHHVRHLLTGVRRVWKWGVCSSAVDVHSTLRRRCAAFLVEVLRRSHFRRLRTMHWLHSATRIHHILVNTEIKPLMLKKSNNRIFLHNYCRAILGAVYLAVAIFIVVDVIRSEEYYQLLSLAGILLYVVIFFVFSHSPADVSTAIN